MNERRRNLSAVWILLDWLRERHLPESALLAGSGIGPESLRDAATTITFAQEYQLIRNLLGLCADESALGLRIGLRYRFTSIAPVGFALVSSPTFRSAFDAFIRYTPLNASLVEVTADDGDADLHIGFRDAAFPADVRRFVVERTIGATLAIAGELIGHAPVPLQLSLGCSGGDTETYRALTGITPRFEQPRSRLVLAGADVDLLLARSNPLALRLAEEQCQRYLAEWKHREGLSARVRELVALQPRHMPSFEQVAATLGLSARTLRRRLQDEGTSYTALCDETRQAIAEQLLDLDRLPVERIAERLGYSDATAFIHAFRRWKGQSPHAYRIGRQRGKD